MANKVFYNPRCSKCRIAVKYMDENNIDYSVHEYLEEGITKKYIKEILKKGNLNINQILRTGEVDYKANIRARDLSDEEKIDAVVKYPKILQRPIILSNKKAIVAREMKSLEKI